MFLTERPRILRDSVRLTSLHWYVQYFTLMKLFSHLSTFIKLRQEVNCTKPSPYSQYSLVTQMKETLRDSLQLTSLHQHVWYCYSALLKLFTFYAKRSNFERRPIVLSFSPLSQYSLVTQMKETLRDSLQLTSLHQHVQYCHSALLKLFTPQSKTI